MLRDDEMFPMATRTYAAVIDSSVDDSQTPNEETYLNDDFDDVFGSAPPSPTLEPRTNTADGSWNSRGGNVEPSDIPRLKEKHETEGYRDGVTKGKGESVQAGFDEGYGLGAVLGLRIGKLLGMLEGIVGAINVGDKIEGGKWEVERKRAESLFGRAKEELGTTSVFGREYWGEDGIWKFEVPGEDKGEVVFPDVAEAHPLIKKWQGILDEEIQRWGLDLNIIEGEHGEEDNTEERKVARDKHAQPTKEPATEPAPAAAGKIMGISKAQLNW